jgi:hypothetical protein
MNALQQQAAAAAGAVGEVGMPAGVHGAGSMAALAWRELKMRKIGHEIYGLIKWFSDCLDTTPGLGRPGKCCVGNLAGKERTQVGVSAS